MNILVAGGGPAGLCFARLMKLRRPSWDVTVHERGRSDTTYGWGITLPYRSVMRLAAADARTARAVVDASVTWEQVQIFHAGRRVDLNGPKLLGLSRLTLLRLLHGACRAAGVQLAFESPIEAALLPPCDLLIVADGARSAIREACADRFGTTVRDGRNRYAWLGTRRIFSGLAFAVANAGHGPLVAHGYPFSARASTFVVECGDDVWQHAGMAHRSPEDACRYLASAFADSLRGQPLVFRGGLRWMRFLHVTNERWVHDRMVMVGDAAHAVHFSVGSGTMLALEDALGLADALDGTADVSAALHAFESTRRTAVADLQALETATVSRLEHMNELEALEPLALAYRLLSR